MIRVELTRGTRPLVLLDRSPEANAGAWSRIQSAMSRGVVGGDRDRLEVRLDVFLAELQGFRDALRTFSQKVEFGSAIREQLQLLAADRKARDISLGTEPVDTSKILLQLKEAGFKRDLKPFQLENLGRILRLPHGADFSVPGAGKTTVALANFAVNRANGVVRRALVVAPISAFPSWKDDAVECFLVAPKVIVHSVGGLIPDDTTILLTNYNRLASDYDRVRAFVGGSPTQVFLDEAHRIKRGAQGVHGRSVLDLAYAAKRRDVLTGTPAPQGAFDLVALVQFLYPGQDNQILPKSVYEERDGREERVLADASSAIGRYFVRTTKSKLDLPPTKFIPEREAMGVLQKAIYDALIGTYKATFELELKNRREFDRLGRIVMYLLEAATNPMLLTAGSDRDDDAAFRHPPLELSGNERLVDLLASYNKYEMPWKYKRVLEIVRQCAENGQKVLIWSNFVRNLKALSRLLGEFKPAIVHGGVPSVDDAISVPFITREKELHRFKYDDTCAVLLANPAACGEGVSLHYWCHHAIYLDRSFNAGHFLQSQDRIHRIGLEKDIVTRFTILSSADSIDDSVDGRLREKVRALSQLMGDPGLVQMALPGEADEEDTERSVIAADDFDALRKHFEEVGRHAT